MHESAFASWPARLLRAPPLARHDTRRDIGGHAQTISIAVRGSQPSYPPQPPYETQVGSASRAAHPSAPVAAAASIGSADRNSLPRDWRVARSLRSKCFRTPFRQRAPALLPSASRVYPPNASAADQTANLPRQAGQDASSQQFDHPPD